MFARAQRLLLDSSVGVYEPTVTHTDIVYRRSRLQSIGDMLYVVPFTDCTCWFVRRDVLQAVPPVDISINRYGWGISVAIAAACRINNKLCIRDYGIRVHHPRGRGYPAAAALAERTAYFRCLSPSMRAQIRGLYGERALLNGLGGENAI